MTLADPVEPAFPRSIALTAGISSVITNEMLPTRCPTLIITSRLPAIPEPNLHAALVSDAHAVISQAVRPTLAELVNDATPTPAPCRLMLADPVVNAFPRRTTLKASTSTERRPETLPTNTPTLSDTRKVPIAPDPA